MGILEHKGNEANKSDFYISSVLKCQEYFITVQYMA